MEYIIPKQDLSIVNKLKEKKEKEINKGSYVENGASKQIKIPV